MRLAYACHSRPTPRETRDASQHHSAYARFISISPPRAERERHALALKPAIDCLLLMLYVRLRTLYLRPTSLPALFGSLFATPTRW